MTESLTPFNFFTHFYIIHHDRETLDKDDHITALAFSILIGVLTLGIVHLGCLIAEKCFTSADKNDPNIQKQSRVGRDKLYKGPTPPPSKPAKHHAKHAVSKQTPKPLKSEMIEIFNALEQATHLMPNESKRTLDGSIKYGKSRCGDLYLEVYDKHKNPFHFNLSPNGSAQKIGGHYNRDAGYPDGQQFEDVSKIDLQLLGWAIGKVSGNEKAPERKTPEIKKIHHKPLHPGSLDKGIQIRGSRIESKYQEQQITSYDWKVAYQNSPLDDMNEFVNQAQNAVLAYSGILSNFQRIPFLDPVTGQQMKSAEHMFQSYKFLPGSKNRDLVLQADRPVDALETARLNRPQGAIQSWIDCALNLMIFIQLCKALEEDTGLKEYLLETGNDFIVEDTSSKHYTDYPEKFWGDNGDGTGQNQLGWAQMQARAFIRNSGGRLDAVAVQEFYETWVKQQLNDYYKDQFPGNFRVI